MLYGSEIWEMREEDMCRFEHTEMRMVRWISNATLRDRTPSVKLRGHLGIEGIADVLHIGRLRWFGYVERIGDDNWVNRYMNVIVEGRAPRGRPRKIWQGVLCNDFRVMGFTRGTANDRVPWRAAIK